MGVLGHWGWVGRLYNRSIIIIFCCPLVSFIKPQIISKEFLLMLISTFGKLEGLQSHFVVEKYHPM